MTLLGVGDDGLPTFMPAAASLTRLVPLRLSGFTPCIIARNTLSRPVTFNWCMTIFDTVGNAAIQR